MYLENEMSKFLIGFKVIRACKKQRKIVYKYLITFIYLTLYLK